MPDQIFPEPTVGAFIFNRQGELLLLQSHKWPGRYIVPGGHVELGETLEQALVRETKEETGLDVHSIEFINFQQFIYDPAFWKKRHFIFFDYACKTDDANVILNDEAEGYVWVEPHQALTLELDRYTRCSVEEWSKKHA
ncbi:MAG: NADH pyrophosphatase [Anaerolineales bacterium]|nr:NADH pyrophosphatase [Anaerolineales bacterium]